MKQFSLYDILGVLAPGVVLTVGILALYPQALSILQNKDVSLGEFGVVLLVAYVLGNLVAALGNLLEIPYWKLFGGNHTARLRHARAKIVSGRQIAAVEERLQAVNLLKKQETISELDDMEWWDISRHVYACLDNQKATQRIEAFNAQYGMNRGIAAGFLLKSGAKTGGRI